MANFRNLAFGLIKTPPTVPASGATVILEPGHGARFPAVPFVATIWPVAVMPDPTNAEVVTVTAVLGDTLTIVRAQQGTAARAIIAGDQIAGTITQAYLALIPLTSDPTVAWAGSQSIGGALTVAGNAVVAGSLNADFATLANGLNANGMATLNALTVVNGVAFGTYLTVAGALTAGQLTVNGDVAIGGYLQQPRLRAYSEPWQQVNIGSGAVAIDYHNGNHVFVYLTENVGSMTITNLPPSQQFAFVMVNYVAQGAARTVAHVINGHGVRFPHGQLPVMSSDSGYIDRILYSTWDGGTTWIGDIIGLHY